MAGVWQLSALLLYLAACMVAIRWYGYKRYLCLLWLVICSGLGYLHYHSYAPAPVYLDQTEFQGTVLVDRLPVLKDGKQRLIVRTAEQQHLQIDAELYPAYHYGDRLDLTCTINLPGEIEGFAYDRYLARYHIQALCKYPQIKLLQTQQGHPWISKIYQLRATLKERVEQLWPEPVAALMLGVLIGAQDTIPEQVYTDFQHAGVVHILVVSGMHVLILVQMLKRATQTLPRFGQLIVIIGVLVAFCVLTGFSATVIRATVMGSIPLLGYWLGRPHKIHLTLTWAAGLVTIVNPYILVHDVGFQLSFLATLGLVYVTPYVQRFTKWLPNTLELRETVTTTIAATTTTAPWIAYIFGTWSNVALLANIIVIPISNLMLSAGAVITGISWLFPKLAQYLAQLLGAAVVWMVRYVEWCASLPHAYVQIF